MNGRRMLAAILPLLLGGEDDCSGETSTHGDFVTYQPVVAIQSTFDSMCRRDPICRFDMRCVPRGNNFYQIRQACHSSNNGMVASIRASWDMINGSSFDTVKRMVLQKYDIDQVRQCSSGFNFCCIVITGCEEQFKRYSDHPGQSPSRAKFATRL